MLIHITGQGLLGSLGVDTNTIYLLTPTLVVHKLADIIHPHIHLRLGFGASLISWQLFLIFRQVVALVSFLVTNYSVYVL